jgi:transcriptional regulator with XRE-family HTH domain
MKKINRLVGLRIRELRKAAGMTQAELAEAAELEVESISRLERGTRGITLDSIDRIAQALGVRLKDFFNFKQARPEILPPRKLLRLYRLLEKLPEPELKKLCRIARILAE